MYGTGSEVELHDNKTSTVQGMATMLTGEAFRAVAPMVIGARNRSNSNARPGREIYLRNVLATRAEWQGRTPESLTVEESARIPRGGAYRARDSRMDYSG